MPLRPWLLVLLLVASSDARIGETPIQFADRYGRPKDTSSSRILDAQYPLLGGAIHHTYEYYGWKIRAAFLQVDGPAVRMEFSKLLNGQNPQIQDFEFEAIATANTPAGMSWKAIPYNPSNSPSNALPKLGETYIGGAMGEKMWQRSDGAIMCLRSHLSVRLELPAARQHEEQLKIKEEQKARASVPHF